MTDKHRALDQCNAILKALLGTQQVDAWWTIPNRAFEMRAPSVVWDSQDWQRVHKYLLGQLNADYS